MEMKQVSSIDRHEIERLLKLGWNQSQIAAHLKFSQATISNELKRGGGKENYTAQNAIEIRKITASKQGWGSWHENTREKHSKMIALYNEGLSVNSIAASVGCAASTVYGILQKFKGKSRIRCLSPVLPDNNLAEEVEALKEHIKILEEYIKSMEKTNGRS